MTALLEAPPLTAEDLLRRSDDRRYELVDGKLVEKTMAATATLVASEIHGLLWNHCRSTSSGAVFLSEQGYQCFPHRPNTVRFPDVSFITRARLSPDLAEGYIRIVPDLVVEVLSPTDLARDVSRRITDYLRAGVRLLWVVDPEARLVFVYHQGRPGLILTEHDYLEGEDVLPGFRVAVREIFRPLELLQPSPPGS
ncbi:MAG: Uma2 family endonuclease [Gemmatales bacterium]|nr:Uma2 family endonuclease [Gemmatales bacterium]